jgi:phosphoribosyl-AMP cyclohydrolase / phosphoribosyl-ATP pyrophosphohydrolase
MFEKIKWDEHGLIPAVVQDATTRQVLMVAYMSAESLQKTLDTGETVFWSRSRRELWHKGETSGNIQRVREIRVDCDEDTLLILVDPAGPACHTGAVSCFYRTVDELENAATPAAASLSSSEGTPPPPMHGEGSGVGFTLSDLQSLIQDRQANPKPGSYTNSLFDAGINRTAQKVGEEATESIVAALGQGREQQIAELSDLFYHTLVLMAQLGLSLDDIQAELAKRHKPR